MSRSGTSTTSLTVDTISGVPSCPINLFGVLAGLLHGRRACRCMSGIFDHKVHLVASRLRIVFTCMSCFVKGSRWLLVGRRRTEQARFYSLWGASVLAWVVQRVWAANALAQASRRLLGTTALSQLLRQQLLVDVAASCQPTVAAAA